MQAIALMRPALIGLVVLAACTMPVKSELRFEGYPQQLGGVVRPPEARSCPRPAAPAPAVTALGPRAGERLELGIDRERIELGAGRWVVSVALPPRRMVTIGVAGIRGSGGLRGFEVIGQGALRKLHSSEDDERMPRFSSFKSDGEPEPLTVVIDADEPLALIRAASEPFDRGASDPKALPLVGMPFPLDRKAGYELGAPSRYAFVRADVAEALRLALRQTRKRFGRNAIAIGDASQWNGQRPATDAGQPRHISHVGGRDVDVGLPAIGAPSRLEKRCEVVLVDKDRATCAPGTVRALDGERLAYLLAQLIDGPAAEVEVIFTDQAYIDAVRQALPDLRRRKWIGDEAFGALGEEGLLRASPWHVDHVHVRFRGEPAITPLPLAFDAADPAIVRSTEEPMHEAAKPQ